MNVINQPQQLGPETMINETEITQQLARTIAWETFSTTPDTPESQETHRLPAPSSRAEEAVA
jgi:hypothetical protein